MNPGPCIRCHKVGERMRDYDICIDCWQKLLGQFYVPHRPSPGASSPPPFSPAPEPKGVPDQPDISSNVGAAGTAFVAAPGTGSAVVKPIRASAHLPKKRKCIVCGKGKPDYGSFCPKCRKHPNGARCGR